jgi:hypothetical protein
MLRDQPPDTRSDALVAKAMTPPRPTAATPLDLALSRVNPFRRMKPSSRPSTTDYAKR